MCCDGDAGVDGIDGHVHGHDVGSDADTVGGAD